MVRKFISTDCHIAPPYELTEELPAKYRDYFPRIEQRTDGDYVVNPIRIGGGGMTLMAGAARGQKAEADLRLRARTANAGVDESLPSYQPDELLADLERDSTYGAVLISRVAYRDDCPVEAQIAYCQMVNDYLAATWKPHLDRVAPGILLPFLDPQACAKELERAAALGLRPGLLPDAIWNQPYHDKAWEPLWETAAALNIPLSLHVGSVRNPPNGEGGRPYPGLPIVGFYSGCVAMGETLGWLVFTGVFKRHPNLRIVMTEGYAGWLSFMMSIFDHHMRDSRFMRAEGLGFGIPKLDAPPSEYLRRQAFATFMWDPVAIRERAHTGTDCLLWANDYPHPEGSFPYSVDWVQKQFDGVPEADIYAITRGNASKLFGITV